jgi:hypothetical protein
MLTISSSQLDALRNTFAIVAAIVSIIVAVVRQTAERRPTLHYWISPLLPIDLDDEGKKRYWRLRETMHKDYVSVWGVHFMNGGRQPIRRDDFDDGRPITVTFKAEVQHLETGAGYPATVRAVATPQADGHSIAVQPLLLNGGDQMECKVLLQGLHPTLRTWAILTNIVTERFTIDTRIEDIRRPRRAGIVRRFLALFARRGYLQGELGYFVTFNLRAAALFSVGFLALAGAEYIVPSSYHVAFPAVSVIVANAAGILAVFVFLTLVYIAGAVAVGESMRWIRRHLAAFWDAQKYRAQRTRQDP